MGKNLNRIATFLTTIVLLALLFALSSANKPVRTNEDQIERPSQGDSTAKTSLLPGSQIHKQAFLDYFTQRVYNAAIRDYIDAFSDLPQNPDEVSHYVKFSVPLENILNWHVEGEVLSVTYDESELNKHYGTSSTSNVIQFYHPGSAHWGGAGRNSQKGTNFVT